MARVLTSFFLALVVSAAFGQAFGRFGYVSEGATPGFEITRQGFRVRHAASDWLKFDNPSRQWKAISTSDTEQIVSLGGVGLSPDKLRQNLLGLGFSLYFQNGIRFNLSSTAAPFVSWGDGSAGLDVPTPASKWLCISFRDQQPPIVIVFEAKPESMKLTGKGGSWRLKSEGAYQGWVRVVAPNGVSPFPTNRAGDLGRLTQQIKANERWLTGEIPAFTDYRLESEATAVTAKYTFDKPGAVVPPAAFLAGIGGYQVRVQNAVKNLNIYTEEGPVQVCEGTYLELRFTVQRLPAGRPLLLQAEAAAPISSASPHDIPSVVELAFANLFPARDLLLKQAAQETADAFLGEAQYVVEPNTGQQLPFDAAGKGLDLLAANGLLSQVLASTAKPEPDSNSLLTSLYWRRDWLTWRFPGVESTVARRAACLAAVAGLIGARGHQCYEAALLEAGLAAERGLQIWKRRRGLIAKEQPLLEILQPFRQAAFLQKQHAPIHPLFKAAELGCVFSDLGFQVSPRESGLRLSWEAADLSPRSALWTSSVPIQVQGTDTASVELQPQDGGLFAVITPKKVGPCEIAVQWPANGGFTISSIPPFAYKEEFR